jgi:hypothetical protein
MKLWIKVLLVTVIFALPAFALGPKIWPPSPDAHPTASQLPWLMALSAIEAVTFGLGMSFLFFGWKRFVGKGAHACWAFASLTWLLVSWWPHDNAHIHNGFYMPGLIVIDYSFHLTLIIASLIAATYAYKVAGARRS